MLTFLWPRSTARGDERQRQERSASDLSPTFDPQLPERLRREHAELLGVLRRLLDAAQNGTLHQVDQDLASFRQMFNRHVQLENAKFYAYMDRRLVNQPLEQRALHARRREANAIAKSVADFIHIWVTVPPTELTRVAFAEQIKRIGAQLVQRIELEESALLPMYS